MQYHIESREDGKWVPLGEGFDGLSRTDARKAEDHIINLAQVDHSWMGEYLIVADNGIRWRQFAVGMVGQGLHIYRGYPEDGDD